MSVHVKSPTIIHVYQEYPSIPIRTSDWQAYFDDYDGAPDAGHQITGSGETMLTALVDIYENYEDWFDTALCAHRPMVEEDYVCSAVSSRS